MAELVRIWDISTQHVNPAATFLREYYQDIMLFECLDSVREKVEVGLKTEVVEAPSMEVRLEQSDVMGRYLIEHVVPELLMIAGLEEFAEKVRELPVYQSSEAFDFLEARHRSFSSRFFNLSAKEHVKPWDDREFLYEHLRRVVGVRAIYEATLRTLSLSPMTYDYLGYAERALEFAASKASFSLEDKNAELQAIEPHVIKITEGIAPMLSRFGLPLQKERVTRPQF